MAQADAANREIEYANKMRQMKDERELLTQQQQKFADERTQYNDTIKTLNTQNTELNKQLTELKQQLQQHTKQLQTLQEQQTKPTQQQDGHKHNPTAQTIHEKQLLKELKQKSKDVKETQIALDYYKQVFAEQNAQLRLIQQDRLMLQRNSLWQGGVSSLLNSVNEGAVPLHQHYYYYCYLVYVY